MNKRSALTKASRIVIKLGTGILTNTDKRPHLPRMTHLIRQICELRERGKEIILVSSGAVGAGRGVLGFDKKPKSLADLQACAAIGQLRLMSTYENLFSIYNQNIAQILLTHDDLEDHDRYLNARSSLLSLLKHRIIPIINENDVVSVEELKFGDNDRLSALVAALLPADLLILLTTVDGLMENFGTPEQKIIHTVEQIDSQISQLANGTHSDTAVGGMKTKILAAEIAVHSGIPMLIANGTHKEILCDLLAGKEIGTLFRPDKNYLPARKRRIAFFHHPRGSIIVDPGACKALRSGGASLLFPGILSIQGNFEEGDVVSVCDADEREFARGIIKISSQDLHSHTIPEDDVIHCNDLVIL